MTASGTACVLGTGPGGLAVATELAGAGWEVRLGDLAEFVDQVDAVRHRGGVTLVSSWAGDETVPVRAVAGIEDAVRGAGLVAISVPTHAHPRFVDEVLPHLEPGATLLFVGEGGGALVAWDAARAAGRTDLLVGETNCLPYMARPAGPGAVLASHKTGGVLAAAMPASGTDRLMEIVAALWPYAEAAESVWETVLINYDAIDTVPVALTSAAKLEARPGGVLFWGEGATPGVVRLIESLDGELLELRRALGHRDERRYRDFLIAQGLAPDSGGLYEVMRAGGITRSYRPSGTAAALRDRVALEVAYCLVLASSLGRAAGVETPVIDGTIALAEAMCAEEFRVGGRALSDVGLAGVDRDGLMRYVRTGELERKDAGDG